jgi:oxygen-independent coproporphyrinogen-3 oxidase
MDGLLEDIHSSDELSLYIHVPFCTTKCSYCAFYSISGQSSRTMEAFATRLHDELRLLMERRSAPFKTVFLGGGNPGILNFRDLCTIVDLVCEKGKPEEFTIEMNPESLRKDLFPIFNRGINRLSIGIQSLNASHLKILGRNASLSESLQAMHMAMEIRNLYGTQLNFDLMTGIPGQSISEALIDIERLTEISKPEHISLYNLTIEEGTNLAKMVGLRTFQPLSEDQQADNLEACWKTLAALGYEHYEVSNFARNGAVCLHNLRYWALQQYVGIGPSAVGTLRTPGGLARWTGVSSIHDYIDNPPFHNYTLERISEAEEITEYLLVALRTKMGIDKAGFAQRFDRIFDGLFRPAIQKIQKSNPALLQDSPDSFTLTEQGWMVMDAIVLDLVIGSGL